MKILFLAIPDSSHTQKWAKSLAAAGLEISIFGLSDCDSSLYEGTNITLHTLNFDNKLVKAGLGNWSKLRYGSAVAEVKKTIRAFKPDIVHAHFASSYGLLGALSGFKPYILSVWGSDIFDFPRKSLFHKILIRYNLKSATKILATGQALAAKTHKYTNQPIEITPFGIDLDCFKPYPVNTLFDREDIVIGTVKALEPIYGIEDLLKAFKIVVDRHPNLPLRLLIVGDGSQKIHLQEVAKELQIDQRTIFTGYISPDQVPTYHNMLSIFVALSHRDSFGVAVIEASACEKPVVVSNVGGLPEVVENGRTGVVVPPLAPEEAAEAIEKLVIDANLRRKMGQAGRIRVQNDYNWPDNVAQMIKIYRHVLEMSD